MHYALVVQHYYREAHLDFVLVGVEAAGPIQQWDWDYCFRLMDQGCPEWGLSIAKRDHAMPYKLQPEALRTALAFVGAPVCSLEKWRYNRFACKF